MPLKNDTRRLAAGRRAVRVLLIEDSDSDAGLVFARLAEINGHFVLDRAISLEEGLSRLLRESFDVALLDLNLPDSVGLPTFELLHEALPLLPVVILTGLDDQQMATSAVAAGAQDYLSKDKADADSLGRALRYAIERQRRRSAERQLRCNEREFGAARAIQQRLLPAAAPVIPGFDIAGACIPAEATGGDYFDYIPMSDGRWGILVGDVSSHGFAPALIMAGTRQVIRTLTRIYSKVDDLLTEANVGIYTDTGSDHFVTLALAQIDPVDGSLVYAGAGHEGYLFRAREYQPTNLASTGYPLGLFPQSRIESQECGQLTPGDALLLLTDGFQESRASDRELFGKRRALDIVAENRQQPAAQIIEVLFSAVQEFCRPGSPQDDVTAVIVKRL